jgi:hypothetical protein
MDWMMAAVVVVVDASWMVVLVHHMVKVVVEVQMTNPTKIDQTDSTCFCHYYCHSLLSMQAASSRTFNRNTNKKDEYKLPQKYINPQKLFIQQRRCVVDIVHVLTDPFHSLSGKPHFISITIILAMEWRMLR